MLSRIDFTQIPTPAPLPKVMGDLLRHTGITHFEPNKEYEYKSDKFIFSQHVFAFNYGEWHVMPDLVIDHGGVSAIFDVSHIIKLGEYAQIQVLPSSSEFLIKKQTPGEMEEIKLAILREARYQSWLNVKVYPALFSEGYGYTLMENCGPNLDQWLKQKAITFDQRLMMVKAICTSVLNATQMGLIHADIKPANLCHTYNGNDIYVRLIDCGAAKLSDPDGQSFSELLDGTPNYMPPETAVKQEGFFRYSHAGDVYSTAGTLGLILGIPLDQLMEYKNQCGTNEGYKAPFNFSTLFDGINIPADVDPILLKNIRHLLEQMQSVDPKDRPDMKYITKFFNAIDQRREELRHFQELKQQLIEAYQYLSTVRTYDDSVPDLLTTLNLHIKLSSDPAMCDHDVVISNIDQVNHLDDINWEYKGCYVKAIEPKIAEMERLVAWAEQIIGMLPSKKSSLLELIKQEFLILEKKYCEIGATALTLAPDQSGSSNIINPWVRDLLQFRKKVLQYLAQISSKNIASVDSSLLENLLKNIRTNRELCDHFMCNFNNMQKTLNEGDTKYEGVQEMKGALKSTNISPLTHLLVLQTIARERLALNHCTLFSRTVGPRALYREMDQLPTLMSEIPQALGNLCSMLQLSLEKSRSSFCTMSY